MPDLKKSAEHVTSADAEAINKELKAATSIQKIVKFTFNIPSCMRTEVANMVTVHKLEVSTI